MSASSENHTSKRQRVVTENREERSSIPLPVTATNQATVSDTCVELDMTQRYLLTVEYIGTAFLGWQKQQGGRTVQGQLEDAIHKFVGRQLQVFGSSRTDTGVHALGNTCHVDIQRISKRNPNQQMPAFEPSVVKNALNHFLQGRGDVAICDVQCIPSHFHARFQATQRTYQYRLNCGSEQSSVFDRQRAWQVKGPLNLVAMLDACRVLEGHHDFSSFRGAGCQANSPLRTLSELQVMETPSWPLFPSPHQRHLDRKHATGGGGGSGRAQMDDKEGRGEGERGGSVGGVTGGDIVGGPEDGMEEGGGGCGVSYVVTARAPSFLYHQVRLLVGLLKSVGCGAHTPSDVKRILDGRSISLMPAMAPAHGLYLAKVHYEAPSALVHSGGEEETTVE